MGQDGIGTAVARCIVPVYRKRNIASSRYEPSGCPSSVRYGGHIYSCACPAGGGPFTLSDKGRHPAGRKRGYDMIIINVDVMLAKRKMSVTELAERVGFTMANVSMIKTGKVKALKLSTLDKLCEALDCQPGDILEYRKDENGDERDGDA